MLQSMGSQRDGHDLVTEKEEEINVWQFNVGYCLLWVALFKFLFFFCLLVLGYICNFITKPFFWHWLVTVRARCCEYGGAALT